MCNTVFYYTSSFDTNYHFILIILLQLYNDVISNTYYLQQVKKLKKHQSIRRIYYLIEIKIKVKYIINK